MTEPDAEHELEHRAASPGKWLVYALIGLLLFTALSFGMHFAPLGGTVGAIVALAIAAAKVTIVAIVFMELGESLAATRWVAVITVAFVALLCLGIVGDVAYR